MSITAETRREAYDGVKLPEMESKVYSILLSDGPMIAEEIMRKMGTHNPNNVRPRLTGLQKKGLIRPIGKRPNRQGRNEAVWEVIPDAHLPGEGRQSHAE